MKIMNNETNDSLDTVEMVMFLEEMFGWNAKEDELFSDPAAIRNLQVIFCKPTLMPWTAPDQSFGWPTRVTSFGRKDNKVLFNAGSGKAFGLGCLSPSKKIENVRMYPSLSRALHAFPHHECRLE